MAKRGKKKIVLKDIYAPRKLILDMCNFPITSFRDFAERHDIKNTAKGYPVLQIISGLRKDFLEARETDYDKELKLARIDKLRVETAEKKRKLIPIARVEERTVSLLSTVRDYIITAIKTMSPRLVGLDSAHKVENIARDEYKRAIKLLEHKNHITDWSYE